MTKIFFSKTQTQAQRETHRQESAETQMGAMKTAAGRAKGGYLGCGGTLGRVHISIAALAPPPPAPQLSLSLSLSLCVPFLSLSPAQAHE
jgi:hypothetical protein